MLDLKVDFDGSRSWQRFLLYQPDGVVVTSQVLYLLSNQLRSTAVVGEEVSDATLFGGLSMIIATDDINSLTL